MNFLSALNQRLQDKDATPLRSLSVDHLENRMMLSTVSIFASGDTGNEIMTLEVNGSLVALYENMTTDLQEFTWQTGDLVTADQVEIFFINDFFDANSGVDQNLTVDRIVIDGETYLTSSPDVYSTGTYDGDSRISGYDKGSTLYGDGKFQYGATAGAGSELKVFVSGQTGEERFDVRVRNESVSEFTATQTNTEYTIELNENVTADDISIWFLNDLYLPDQGFDRNLIVDKIVVDGATIETESPDTYSTGVYSEFFGGAFPGNYEVETLHSNGFFQYSDNQFDITPPSVSFTSFEFTDTGETSLPISITISDNEQPSFPGRNAITIIEPDGDSFLPREIFGNNNGDGTLGVFYQFMQTTPFTSADNGVFEVYLNDNSISDAAGNFASGDLLGTITVNIPVDNNPDLTPPVATLLTTGVVNQTQVTVQWEDDVQMGSILDGAITIVGPNDYLQEAEFVGGGGLGTTIRSGSYVFQPPGEIWTPADDGEYTVFHNGDRIFDFAGNDVPAGVIGTFTLQQFPG